MCVTEPFQLFSDEGIRMIRRDLLRKEVLDKHLTAWERAPCTIAGAEEVRHCISWKSGKETRGNEKRANDDENRQRSG